MIREPRLLDGSLNEVRRIHPVSFSITENSTPLSTASIQLQDGDNLPERAWVEMYTPNGSAGVYRVRMPQDGYGEQTSSVELEHGITEVGDYLVNAEIREDMALKDAIAAIFGYYTTGAGANARWQLGANTFTDTVGVDVDHEKVLEAILMLLDQTPYIMAFDFTTSPWTVNIVQADQTVTAEGRLNRNILSAQVQRDDSELATRVYAAYEADDGDGELTLEWIYEQDNTAIAKYGIVEDKLQDTYEDETAARAAAVKYLNKHKRTKISVSITGYDFSSVTGESLDLMRIGKKYRLAIEGESEPVEEVIRTITWQGSEDNEYSAIINLAEEDDILIKTLNENKSIAKAVRRTKKQADGLHYAFYSEDGYLRSQFDFTESYFRTAFQDFTNNLRSSVEQTASYWRSTYEDLNNNLRGQVEQTAAYWRSTYEDLNNNLRGQVEQTAAYWRSTYQDTYNGFKGVVEQTASYWRSTYQDAQNNLGVIEQTASYWRSVYSDAQNNLGQIEQTASYWRSTYSDAQNNLGQIEQTASYWRATYQDANSLIGQIEQTASYWRGIYTDTANSLRSEVQQTASYWRTQIVNEGANQRSSIVQTAASLSFTADQIYLNGTTTIADMLGVNADGYLTVNGDIYQSGTIYPSNVTISRLGALRMWTGNPGTQVSVYGSDLEDMIIKASVSGDTLYLWKRGENTSSTSGILSFRKAVTLQGTWSNGVYSVSATSGSITGTAPWTQLGSITPVQNSVVSRNGKYVERPFKVQFGAGENLNDTGYEQNVTINAESVYNYGWNQALAYMVIPTADIGSNNDGTYSKVTVEKPNADGANTTIPFEYSLNLNSSFRPTGSSADVYAIEIKYGNNVVARKTVSVSASAEYNATNWSDTIYNYLSSSSEYTKTTYSSLNYYFKNGTSGMSKVVAFHTRPSVSVDGHSLVSNLVFTMSNYATAIYREGYRDGTNDAGSSGSGYNSGWFAAAADCRLTYEQEVSGHGTVTFDYNPETTQPYAINRFKIRIPSENSVNTGYITTYYLVNTKNTTYVKADGTGDSAPIVAGLTHNQYNEGWSAARAQTSGTFTATISGTSYEFPYLPTDTPANLKPVFGVAIPNATVDGGKSSYYYYLSSDNDVAYLRYGSQNGKKVAQFSHNMYTNGWNAARAKTSGTYTATVNSESRTYPFLPTATPNNMAGILGVSIPSATVGSNSSYFYYLTSDDDTCYIRYGSRDGVKVAQYQHNKYNNGWVGCYNDIGLNYSSNQALGYNGSITIYPAAKSSPNASHSSIISKGITITAPADRYDTGYNAFKNKIFKYLPDSARNHVTIDVEGNKRGTGESVAGCSISWNGKQYWNVKVYDNLGNELLYTQTNQSSNGFIVDQKNVTVTANGTYYIGDAVSHVVVSVPTSSGGGSSGPTNHTGFYISVTQDSTGKHVTCSVTYPLSSNVPSFFQDGSTKQLYWY